MKVLHVLNSRIYSGAEKVACQICHMFCDDAQNEMRYCSPYSENVEEMLAKENVTYLPVKNLTPRELSRIIRQERYSGTMQRSFYVGDGITEEDIKARYENGVLSLMIPKKEAKREPEKKTILIE